MFEGFGPLKVHQAVKFNVFTLITLNPLTSNGNENIYDNIYASRYKLKLFEKFCALTTDTIWQTQECHFPPQNINHIYSYVT